MSQIDNADSYRCLVRGFKADNDKDNTEIAYNLHTVAVLLEDATGETCACDVNCNDDWLPYVCDYRNDLKKCPDGGHCWEQWIKHRLEKQDVLNQQE